MENKNKNKTNNQLSETKLLEDESICT